MATSFVLASLASLWAASPPITAIAFAPDGQQLLVGSQAGVEVRSWPDLSLVRRIPTRLAHVHDIVFSPQRGIYAVAGGSPAEVGAVEVWKWPRDELQFRLEPHADVIYQVAWSSDARRLACAGGDQLVSVIDVPSEQVVQKLHGHSRAVSSLVYLPGDRLLVTASLDETLRVWDLTTNSVVRSLTNHTGGLRDVALRPHSDAESPVVASAGADRTLRFWQPLTGRLLRFAKLPFEPLDVIWVPDGSRLIAACADGQLRVIDWQSVETIREQPAVDGWAYAVVLAADSSQAVVGGTGGQLKVVDTGKRAESGR